jgi:pilus assembly protein CpaE
VRCFLIGSDQNVLGRLTVLAAEIVGSEPAILPNLQALRSEPSFIEAERALVLIPAREGDAGEVGAVETLVLEEAGRCFAVCIAETIAPDSYKRLVRTGSAEWIAWPGDEGELRDLVARLKAAEPRAPRGTARIISLLPSKGGVGTTTLAVEAAYRLALDGRGRNAAGRKRGDRRVAILDLNFQGGTATDALDLEPRFDVVEILNRPERLDEHLVEIFTSRHPSGLDVFASPRSRLGLDAVRPEIVFTLIDAVARRYDALLVDLPAVWLAWTDNVVRGSDAVVVTGGETVPALRRLKATLGWLKACGVPDSRVAVAVNGVATDLLGRPAGRRVIERALAEHRTFLLRRDDESLREALDVGRPAFDLAPGGRLARDLKPLLAWMDSIVARHPAADQPSRKEAA